MYNVQSQLQLSNTIVSNHFYCHIQQERLLYDAEHDHSAIAQFLVDSGY